MNIDFSLVQSAQAQADQVLLDRQFDAKAECKKRISAVLSQTAQLNLAADAASGRLNATDIEALSDWRDWVDSMRNAWAQVAQVSTPHQADDLWPSPPQSVVALAEKY